MSLRTRLTILYTSLVGGILLLFGLTVYQTVSAILMEQIDRTLALAYQAVLELYNEGPAGEVGFRESDTFNPPANVVIQLWDRNGQLKDYWPNYTPRALDPLHTRAGTPRFASLYVGDNHLRVLTAPILVGDFQLGTVQVGAGLSIVDSAQQVLLVVLLVGVVVSMSLAAVAAWFSTHQVLIPLEAVTQTALQITRADDLSRRIPSHGLSQEDEIGQLITAFNLTLGRLEQLFNTQRRFLIDVGHELRTPLTVIKGNAALMRRFGEGDPELLDSIESEADRLTRLAGDLLLLSQAESGKLPLDRRQVEIDTLALEVLQQMKVLAKDQVNIKLGYFDQVLVCGDRDRLKQVFVNLVSNAVRYTPAGGEVVLSVGKTETNAWIRVEDSGPGIASEDLPHIFERFYRGEKSRTRSRDGQGFGLGLSIAYWIVRNHDGKIEVQSQLDEGTTFTVSLPLAVDNCEKSVRD
jgi:two-component system, OmpR family, sensor kinase